MLIIKRIAGCLIDIIFFISITLLLYPILLYSKIGLGHIYFMFISFCLAFFIPILFLKNSVGYKILKINVDSYLKLLLKFFIYYFIFSDLISPTLSFLSYILNQSVSAFLTSYSVIFVVIILSVNLLMFLVSCGKCDLFDYILKIRYSNTEYKRNEIITLLLWLFIGSSTLVTALFIKMSYVDNGLNFIDGKFKQQLITYYPVEVFEKYSKLQFEGYEERNDIISLADRQSFIENRLLGQKTIYALINKSTFEDDFKRYELCVYLNYYSQYSALLNDMNNPVQTRFFLVYNERNTYFTHISYVFKYYHDSNEPMTNIHGGYELDSVTLYHKSRLLHFEKSLKEALKMNGEDSLLTEINKGNSIKLSSKSIIDSLNYCLDKNKNEINNLIINTVSFNEVKSVKTGHYNFPRSNVDMIEFFNTLSTNEELSEAVLYRNSSANLPY